MIRTMTSPPPLALPSIYARFNTKHHHQHSHSILTEPMNPRPRSYPTWESNCSFAIFSRLPYATILICTDSYKLYKAVSNNAGKSEIRLHLCTRILNLNWDNWTQEENHAHVLEEAHESIATLAHTSVNSELKWNSNNYCTTKSESCKASISAVVVVVVVASVTQISSSHIVIAMTYKRYVIHSSDPWSKELRMHF